MRADSLGSRRLSVVADGLSRQASRQQGGIFVAAFLKEVPFGTVPYFVAPLARRLGAFRGRAKQGRDRLCLTRACWDVDCGHGEIGDNAGAGGFRDPSPAREEAIEVA